MSRFKKDITKEQLAKASDGELCPFCLGTEVEYVGMNPCLTQTNSMYDCKDTKCGGKWEGN